MPLEIIRNDMTVYLVIFDRAGFALRRSSKFDVIMEYFIGKKNCDVFTINEALLVFDQSLLGA